MQLMASSIFFLIHGFSYLEFLFCTINMHGSITCW